MTEALFPLRLYIYDAAGHHDSGIEIRTESQLNGVGMRWIIHNAVAQKREVRITDPADFLVFHSRDGKILFPEDQEAA